ncbi:hypothetical protein J4409_01605 [Candidatus Woesearchaeota archaeon]|nr:hypothetical protein [Candidatus Woesearchaeota archaeon]
MAIETTQQDASYILNEVVNRLRSLESKYNLITEKTLLINKNMIDEYKSLSRHIKIIESDIKEIKLEVNKLKEIIREFAKEFDSYARKENVKVLEKYINLIDPLKFVTEDDVKRIVKEVIKSE